MQARATAYKETKTFKFPNMIITVHIPDLAEEERKARLKEVHTQAEKLLKSQQKRSF